MRLLFIVLILFLSLAGIAWKVLTSALSMWWGID